VCESAPAGRKKAVVGVGHYQKIQLFCQPLSLKVKAVRDEVQQKFSFEMAEKGGEA
jgi:hypothetical protein